jgi:hypothetical protein
MKTLKSFLLFFVIGFLLSMASLIYNKFTYFEPMDKISINAQKIGSYEVLNVHLNKKGCYEVGLSSYDRIFGEYKIDGQYKLQYFHENKLLEEKIIDKNMAWGVFSRTNYSKSLFDSIEVPFKGHNKLTIKLSVIRPEKIFESHPVKTYLYVDRSDMICGEPLKREQEQKRVAKLTIDTNETNETLMPLAKALWEQNTLGIKQIIPTKIDVNVSMVAERNPLHYAAYLNDIDTLRYLIAQGANLNAQDIQKHTPLYYAITGKTTFLDWLKETHYSNENNASIQTIKLLIDSGADINMVEIGDNKYPPLFYVACIGNYDLTELLLQLPSINKEQLFEGYNLNDAMTYCFREPKQDWLNQQSHQKRQIEIKKMKAFLKEYGVGSLREEEDRKILQSGGDITKTRQLKFDKEIR